MIPRGSLSPCSSSFRLLICYRCDTWVSPGSFYPGLGHLEGIEDLSVEEASSAVLFPSIVYIQFAHVGSAKLSTLGHMSTLMLPSRGEQPTAHFEFLMPLHFDVQTSPENGLVPVTACLCFLSVDSLTTVACGPAAVQQ
jgi:hypothetical protein